MGFERDEDVGREEASIVIDEKSGTRIYEDAGKTVFANWVYVSPQEKVTVIYKYLLPFKIKFSDENTINSYSLLAQKQSGSLGDEFDFEMRFPKKYNTEWKSDKLKECQSGNDDGEKHKLCFSGKLIKDKFFGVVWTLKE